MEAQKIRFITPDAMTIDTSESSSIDSLMLLTRSGAVAVTFRSAPERVYFYNLPGGFTEAFSLLAAHDSLGRYVGEVKSLATSWFRRGPNPGDHLTSLETAQRAWA